VVRIVAQYVMDVSPGVLIGFESEVPDTFSVKTNQKLLAYSVSEIIFNAVKYSDREHIVVRIVLTARTIRFIVEDTGRGIAEADRNRIFMFFTKVDDYSEGLGLGLPLAKSHANVLGGDCMLDPDYHDGCRFIFELPLR
jgi:signal transduction histidine kinase